MAEEMRKIQSRGLRGYSTSDSDGLWVEWSSPEGAWYAVVTLYDYEGGGVVARYTFPLTNEVDDFSIINDHTFTEAVSGHTYIVGLKYLPEADSEAWSESDETLTTLTYTGPNNPPPPNPLRDVEFKIRDYDDDGVQVDYIGHNWTTFVSNTPASGANSLRVYIKKSTDSEYTEITGINPSVNRDVSGTNGDFDWEAGIYSDGYYPDWLWLNFTNLEPLTTYVILAEGELSGECYPLINGTEIEWTTTEEPIQTTQLDRPSINAYPRASGTTKYTTLQIRLSKTIANATSYEYQIALDENFTSGVKTRTSSTVTSGYPLSGYFTGLTSGTKYYCRARSLSDNPAYTTSEWSNVTNTVVASKLPAPTGLEATVVDESTATLSWNTVDNATGGYSVRWRKVNDSVWNTQNVQ